MRSVQRNKQRIYYSLLIGSEEVTDEYGNVTGEFKLLYSTPQPLKINIGTPKGTIELEMYLIVYANFLHFHALESTSKVD